MLSTTSNSPLEEKRLALLEAAKVAGVTDPVLNAAIKDAAEGLNAADCLLYSVAHVAKRLGYEGDVGDFKEAFYWLQEKGSEVHSAIMSQKAGPTLDEVRVKLLHVIDLLNDK